MKLHVTTNHLPISGLDRCGRDPGRERHVRYIPKAAAAAAGCGWNFHKPEEPQGDERKQRTGKPGLGHGLNDMGGNAWAAGSGSGMDDDIKKREESTKQGPTH